MGGTEVQTKFTMMKVLHKGTKSPIRLRKKRFSEDVKQL